MRSHRKKFLFSVIAILVVASGCGNGNGSKGVSNLYSTSAQMSAIGDLTPEERAIATRICYAYQSKNSNFRVSPYLGGLFSFNVTASTCDGQNLSYTVPSILGLNQSVLYFKADNTRAFTSTVQTNEYGFLSQLCSKIQANLAISNTTAISNTKIQVKFYKDKMDSYTLKYFSMSTNQIMSAETFQVRTQFNVSTGQILGMDESYAKQETCISNPAKFSEFSQSFTSFAPN